MTAESRPYVARIGKRCRLVWAEHETAPYAIDKGISASDNWAPIERQCASVYGIEAQPYGVTF